MEKAWPLPKWSAGESATSSADFFPSKDHPDPRGVETIRTPPVGAADRLFETMEFVAGLQRATSFTFGPEREQEATNTPRRRAGSQGFIRECPQLAIGAAKRE